MQVFQTLVLEVSVSRILFPGSQIYIFGEAPSEQVSAGLRTQDLFLKKYEDRRPLKVIEDSELWIKSL